MLQGRNFLFVSARLQTSHTYLTIIQINPADGAQQTTTVGAGNHRRFARMVETFRLAAYRRALGGGSLGFRSQEGIKKVCPDERIALGTWDHHPCIDMLRRLYGSTFWTSNHDGSLCNF